MRHVRINELLNTTRFFFYISESKENYDVRVGNMLYKFFTVHTNVNYSEAEMACQKAMVYRPHPLTVDFRIGTLATVSHAQQYMQLSSEMRILYNAEKTTKYWMGKSTSYIDFQDNRYVVRDAGLRGREFTMGKYNVLSAL